MRVTLTMSRPSSSWMTLTPKWIVSLIPSTLTRPLKQQRGTSWTSRTLTVAVSLLSARITAHRLYVTWTPMTSKRRSNNSSSNMSYYPNPKGRLSSSGQIRSLRSSLRLNQPPRSDSSLTVRIRLVMMRSTCKRSGTDKRWHLGRRLRSSSNIRSKSKRSNSKGLRSVDWS